MGGWVGGWIDVWMDGRMDGWMDESWMLDGWINRYFDREITTRLKLQLHR